MIGLVVGQGPQCGPNSWWETTEVIGASNGNYIFTYVISGAVSTNGAVIQARLRPVVLGNSTSVVVQAVVSRFQNLSRPVKRLRKSAFKDGGTNYRTNPGNWVARFVVSQLNPGTKYFYGFFAPDGFGSATGRFRTIQSPGTSTNVKIVQWSCIRKPPITIGEAMFRENAHFAIGNGDSIYAEKTVDWTGSRTDDLCRPCCLDPVPIRGYYDRLYFETRSDAVNGDSGKRNFLKDTAHFMVLDDHEITDNFAGRGDQTGGKMTDPIQIFDRGPNHGQLRKPLDVMKQLGQLGIEAFYTHNAHFPSYPVVPGVDPVSRQFHNFRVGTDLEVIILDLRQYRDQQADSLYTCPLLPPGRTQSQLCQEFPTLCSFFAPQDEPNFYRTNRTALGRVQKQWLKNVLKKSTAEFKLVVSTYNWMQQYCNPQEYMTAYREERDEILRFIETNLIENVVFLEGDLHAAYFNRVNPGRSPVIWEVIVGASGDSVRPSDLEMYNFLNKYNNNGYQYQNYSAIQYLYTGGPNYQVIRVKNKRMTIETRTPDGRIAIDLRGRRGVLSLPNLQEPVSPPLAT